MGVQNRMKATGEKKPPGKSFVLGWIGKTNSRVLNCYESLFTSRAENEWVVCESNSLCPSCKADLRKRRGTRPAKQEVESKHHSVNSFSVIPVLLAPFLLYTLKEQTKPYGPWEMPLLSAAAEVLLSTVAMAENMNLSHCHARSLVTPSGRTESISPQPCCTSGKQQISALRNLFHPRGKKKDKDPGSSSFYLT